MPVQNTVIGRTTKKDKIEASKALRHGATEAERMLWAKLRHNRLDGWHFRRQQVIAGFIVDFYCHAAALIIEVDGEIHKDQAEYDHERSRMLEILGYRILRFANEEVYGDIEKVIEAIREYLSPSNPRSIRAGEEPNPPAPFPKREGGVLGVYGLDENFVPCGVVERPVEEHSYLSPFPIREGGAEEPADAKGFLLRGG